MNGTDLLFMDDIEGNYIKSFEATIIKKGTDDKGRNYLVLDRSAFYPEGGGQPTDTGIILWEMNKTGEKQCLRVVFVSKGNEIRHFVEEKKPENNHFDNIEPGTKVKGVLDWKRRYAHMRFHTSQHLLSGVVWELYNAATVGNQIHAEYSRVDFSPLSLQEVNKEEVERRCNEIIRNAPEVKIYFEDREKLERSGKAKRCNLHLLPKSVKTLRIVKIEGVELCPCAGTHLRNAALVGGIRITQLRSKGKGKVRITYELTERDFSI